MQGLKRFISQNRITTRCLTVWLVLLPLAIWLDPRTDVISRTVSNAVNALAGAMGGVVIAAFILERWRVAEDDRHSHVWLADHAELIAETTVFALGDLAALVNAAYDVVTPMLAEDQWIPCEQLSEDLHTLPHASDTPSERLSAIQEHWKTGPIATAKTQVRTAAWELATRRISQKKDLTGSTPDALDVGTAREVQELALSLAERLDHHAPVVGEAVALMTHGDAFTVLRKLATHTKLPAVRSDAVLLNSVWHLRADARRLHDDVEQVVDDADAAYEITRDILAITEDVLGTIASIRRDLYWRADAAYQAQRERGMNPRGSTSATRLASSDSPPGLNEPAWTEWRARLDSTPAQ